MSTAKTIEITSESPKSYDDAILQGIEEAGRTVKSIQSAWVKDHQLVFDGRAKPLHRVNMKVTFVVDGSS